MRLLYKVQLVYYWKKCLITYSIRTEFNFPDQSDGNPRDPSEPGFNPTESTEGHNPNYILNR